MDIMYAVVYITGGRGSGRGWGRGMGVSHDGLRSHVKGRLGGLDDTAIS